MTSLWPTHTSGSGDSGNNSQTKYPGSVSPNTSKKKPHRLIVSEKKVITKPVKNGSFKKYLYKHTEIIKTKRKKIKIHNYTVNL